MMRSLQVVSQTEGSHITLDGKEYINFSSNNYLGLARHPQVVNAAKEVMDHWGVGATSSRLISGSSIIHQDLESALAAYIGTDAALLFPTGYQANLGAITSLVGPGDAIVMDRLCHASLVDAAHLSGARLFVYAHGDVAAAEAALERAATYSKRLLVTESLFSMDGDFAPMDELRTLAKNHKAISLVDQAHAIGVWDLAKGWDVTVGTLSKALGSQGGFVAGSKELIDTLVNKARSFIYTTGLSPVCVAAGFAALSLVQEDVSARQKVQQLSKQLRDRLRAQGWNILSSQSQIIPVLLGTPERTMTVSAVLKDAGYFAPAIRPPTVHTGQCRIRLSVTCQHEERELIGLLEVLSPLAQETAPLEDPSTSHKPKLNHEECASAGARSAN
jgi:8-amino-7-oxononanoate synthase